MTPFSDPEKLINHLQYIRRTVKYMTLSHVMLGGLALLCTVYWISEKPKALISAILIILTTAALWQAWTLNRYWHALDRALEMPSPSLSEETLVQGEHFYWQGQRIYTTIHVALIMSLFTIAAIAQLLAVMHLTNVGLF